MLNKEKGITLIALVITIIVLLILAGVSIAMLTGQNGILTQADNASTATLRGEIEEAVKLGVSSVNTYLMTPSSVRRADDPGYTELSYANIAAEINKSYGSSTSGTPTATVLNNTDGATPIGLNYTTGGKTYKVTFTINNTTRSISNLSVDMDNPTDAT